MQYQGYPAGVGIGRQWVARLGLCSNTCVVTGMLGQNHPMWHDRFNPVGCCTWPAGPPVHMRSHMRAAWPQNLAARYKGFRSIAAIHAEKSFTPVFSQHNSPFGYPSSELPRSLVSDEARYRN